MTLPFWITHIIDNIKDDLESMSYSQFKDKCEKSFDEIMKNAYNEDLVRLAKKHGVKTNESIELNEDARHWWDMIKAEAFPTLAFYPALQVWLEFDKMLKGTPYSGKVIGFYASFWLLLVSGKYIAGWLNWKKDSKDEYNKEKAMGKGGII